ncbi:MAG: VWA domain-containing protein [Fuerstiella sp.]
MTDWYYKLDDQIRGPVSRQELDFLAREGRIRPSSRIRKGSDGPWKRYEKKKQSVGRNHQRLAGSKLTQSVRTGTTNPEERPAEDDSGAPGAAESIQILQPRQSDSTRRQAAAGITLAIAVLLCLWLFWESLQSGGLPGDSASQGTANASEGSSTDVTAASKPPSKKPAVSQSASGSAADAPDTVSENQAGQPAQTDQASTSTTDNAAGSGTTSNKSQSKNVEAEAVVSEQNALATDVRHGQGAVVPGDPSSKFTISAPGEATFFGLQASGRRFAFVVDCSGSMNGIPLQRAKDELMTCVNSLPAHVEVLVVFFDDVAHPAPGGYKRLGHRRRSDLDQWVSQVTVGGGTNVNAGMQHAFDAEEVPDAVFLLTDGQFDSGSPAFIRNLNSDGKVRINTVALVSPSGEALLRQIAEENNGDYRFVP